MTDHDVTCYLPVPSVYRYDGTDRHRQRLADGTDRCPSTYREFDLVLLVRNGKIRNPLDRRCILTTGSIRATPRVIPVFIYAVDVNYRMKIYEDGQRTHLGSVKHETLHHNAELRAAGEIQVDAGIVVDINDHSGSYGTYGMLESDPTFAEAVREALEIANAPYSDGVHQLLRRRRG